MAEAEALQDAAQKKKSKLPLILGLVLFLGLGGGGFYAVYSGMILAPKAEGSAGMAGTEPAPDIAFVPIAPVTISLGKVSDNHHLRFTAQLEVNKPKAEEVTALVPRILDVLNGYLRAVETAELEDPDALVRLRSQMLRRIQIVTGEGRVRDLLVTEFVLD
ncbi:flagellar basal body protein FliL [bacterium]|nr:flagellar basal body protein FliL [bacterium]